MSEKGSTNRERLPWTWLCACAAHGRHLQQDDQRDLPGGWTSRLKTSSTLPATTAYSGTGWRATKLIPPHRPD